jgi:poly(3-hydroxybutyrate) depolymerase
MPPQGNGTKARLGQSEDRPHDHMMRALTRCCPLVIAMLAPTLGAAVTPSAGCGKTLASGSYQLTDQNVTRTYRVFVPSGYKPGIAHPLVMVFHGWGGDENEFLGDTNVTTLANRHGYIVVAPRGLMVIPRIDDRTRSTGRGWRQICTESHGRCNL